MAWLLVNRSHRYRNSMDDHQSTYIFKPCRLQQLASKCVLSERVWLNRDKVSIPANHLRVPHLLSGVAAIGALLVIVGVILLHPFMTLLGAAFVYGGKLWFLDRMVWLYEDMKHHPAYSDTPSSS